MNILNDNETININENHKNIEKEELENIIKKLDVKKACGEDKITNKMIKLTCNGTKEFLLVLSLLPLLCNHGNLTQKLYQKK